MANLRTERMMNSVPDYYLTSAIFEAIQAAQAYEYDNQEIKDLDLQQQLSIQTSTWGLKYYEEALGIASIATDSYDVRRSRVLSQMRGTGNFSAALVKSICEVFTNGTVEVEVDMANQKIIITFTGISGVPLTLSDLQAAVDNIVHAHIGVEYKYTYMRWDELDSLNYTWDELDSLNYTWDEFEKLRTVL